MPAQQWLYVNHRNIGHIVESALTSFETTLIIQISTRVARLLVSIPVK